MRGEGGGGHNQYTSGSSISLLAPMKNKGGRYFSSGQGESLGTRLSGEKRREEDREMGKVERSREKKNPCA